MNIQPAIDPSLRAALLDMLRGDDRPVLDDEMLVSAVQLRAQLGGVSDMWIWRRLQDPNPETRLPEPSAVIAGRRYWKVGQIREWLARQSQRKPHKPPRRFTGAQIAAALEFMRARLSPEKLEEGRRLLEALREPDSN